MRYIDKDNEIVDFQLEPQEAEIINKAVLAYLKRQELEENYE